MKRTRNAMYLGVSLAIALASSFAVACATEEQGELDDQEWGSGQSEGEMHGAASEAGSEDDVVVAGEADEEDVSAQASCSFVEWCNAPGGDGTVCRQTGCGRSEAIAECRREVTSLCGRPTCPWIFVSPGGGRTDLCNCSPNCNITEPPAED